MSGDMEQGTLLSSGDEDFDSAFDGVDPGAQESQQTGQDQNEHTEEGQTAGTEPAEEPTDGQEDGQAKTRQSESWTEEPASVAQDGQGAQEPPQVPDDLREWAEDWGPELERYVRWQADQAAAAALTPERAADLLKAAGIDPDALRAASDRQRAMDEASQASDAYRAAVLKDHPDADRVMVSADFHSWIETQDVQSPDDPKEASRLLSSYKEAVAKRSADDFDGRFAEASGTVKEVLSGTVGNTGRSGRSGEPQKQKTDDFDSAFDEAAR